MDENYSLIRKSTDTPDDADFCFIMDDDSMEPLIIKGSRVYVSCTSPAGTEPGLFLYRGKIYCRQFCEDYAGSLHLLCANPRREARNLCLDREEQNHCRCLGRVLLDKKHPLPLYI